MVIKQQRFKISPTSKGAIFKLKRWFYLTFFTKASKEVREKNREEWLKLSRKLIQEINERNASEKPARITLEYEVGLNNEFKPISATIELMEIKPIESFKIQFKEMEKEEGKEAIKAQLLELLKKARELGITPEDLMKQL